MISRTITAIAIVLPASLAFAQSQPTATPPESPAKIQPSPDAAPAPNPTSPMNSSSSMTKSGAESADGMKTNAMAPKNSAMAPKNTAAAPAADTTDKSVFYDTHADQSDMMMSNYLNHTVYGPNDQSLGSVTDIVANADGKAVAAIIGVGGFLGIGEKNVAIAFNSLQWKTKNGSKYITLNVTRDQLKSAPAFNMPKAM